jgi:uncharacterized phage-like protein YoqJ
MGKTLCFTGHRPDKLGGYIGAKALTIQHNLQDKIKDIIRRAYAKGFDTFISGGALGVDQFAATAVMELEEEGLPIKLIIARPFPSQACKWPEKSQKWFNVLCQSADEVIDVSPDPYEPAKMQTRNIWMVDHADAVVAVWNGGRGGTANCIEYAQSKFRPILFVNPYTLACAWDAKSKKEQW